MPSAPQVNSATQAAPGANAGTVSAPGADEATRSANVLIEPTVRAEGSIVKHLSPESYEAHETLEVRSEPGDPVRYFVSFNTIQFAVGDHPSLLIRFGDVGAYGATMPTVRVLHANAAVIDAAGVGADGFAEEWADAYENLIAEFVPEPFETVRIPLSPAQIHTTHATDFRIELENV